MTNLALEIQLLVSNGYGWEDVYVRLLAKGLVNARDRDATRRYVMSLHPRVRTQCALQPRLDRNSCGGGDDKSVQVLRPCTRG